MAVSPDTAQSLIKELFFMGRAIRAALSHPEEGDLLPGGIGVLGSLEARGPCRQVDLAADLCISQSTLSRHVAELVSSGNIARHADPDDGRATLIQITADGSALLRCVRVSRARALQAALANWSEVEAEQAATVVQKLRNSLAAVAHHTAVGERRPVSTESQESDV
ncbi:winged helix-turn-helix transcriptional regulator [Nocardia uniformis]|uniref:Winged helix-turn-helix transcriptional regulator n=1 Tax=Nocardia uniformis TaxID=53432 RepID=A0A849BSF7_9NOCA|nr:MarR family winged helix-turn-helix transcriptional regulator [Nocardia uniformis]NNH69562.1 winged helix-turn-helix transcriptional regulator [Nocardia uniformis]